MTQTYIKNRLYRLLALLFCINLQTIATTQPNTEQTITQSLPDSNLTHAQSSRYIRPKPKPNNTVTQNTAWSQNSTQLQNAPAPYNMTAQQNNPSSLDSSFGPNGKGYVINPIGTNAEARAVTTQDNNKIVVVGVKDNKGVLVRYNENGLLDKSFGGTSSTNGTGIVTVVDNDSAFNTVVIQKDRKIVVAGRGNGTSTIKRYYENGSQDIAFGLNTGSGRTFPGAEWTAIALQDDKIVATGYFTDTGNNIEYLILARFNISDGERDSTFAQTGSPGIAMTRIGNSARSYGIAIQPDNKIIVVGSGNKNQTAIVRYNSDGSLDTRFGADRTGIVTISMGIGSSVAYGVAIQEDNKIVVVGLSHGTCDGPDASPAKFTLTRLTPDGYLDKTFADNGIQTTRPLDSLSPTPNYLGLPSYARSVIISANDAKITVIGHVDVLGKNVFTIARFNEDGSIDNTFGDHGIGAQAIGLSVNDIANQNMSPVVGTLQNDKNKLILAGTYSPNNAITNGQFAVARYLNSLS